MPPDSPSPATFPPRVGAPARALNRARLLWSYWRKEEISRGIPLAMHIEITNRCNLDCPMCLRDAYPQEERDMEMSLFLRMLNEIGPWLDLAALYGRGEPLLCPTLFPMIRECHRRRIAVKLCTNGTLLDEAMSEAILREGVSHVNIGIDGNSPEVYARYRKGGSFAAVIENVERFLRMKIKLRARTWVAIQMIRMAGTEPETEAFLARWKRVPGANVVRVKEDEVKVDGYDLHFLPPRTPDSPCLFPWLGPMEVKADGSYHFHGWADQCLAVNAYDTGVIDAWNGPEYIAWRRAHLANALAPYDWCARCLAPKPRWILTPVAFLANQDWVAKQVGRIEGVAMGPLKRLHMFVR